MNIRFATPGDIPVILDFIRQLAVYEKMGDQVVATEEMLAHWIFTAKKAEVLLATVDEKPVGFALFFHNFSTFEGRAGMYLEDLYVVPSCRGMGIGKALFCRVAAIGKERGCPRMEWSCLNWNAPSIAFYKKMGAVPMEDWTVYRLTGEALQQVAKGDSHDL